jgi:SAM-dependent methyltransferase
MGDISWLRLRSYELRNVLGPVYSRLFPKVNDILRTELADCESVLDLGCGPESGIAQCAIPFSVGVELYEPWLIESQRKSIHSEYILADIRRIDFKPKSFDAVLAIEVLEHLTKQEGYELITKMEGWAKKKIIITTPNGYAKQNPSEGNLLQEHKSGWRTQELVQLGFKVRGIEGWKELRGYQGVVKYKPAFVWGRISDLTQKMTYYYPGLAFRLLAVKRTKEAHLN